MDGYYSNKKYLQNSNATDYYRVTNLRPVSSVPILLIMEIYDDGILFAMRVSFKKESVILRIDVEIKL